MSGSRRIVVNKTHPVKPFRRHRPGVRSGKADVPVSGYVMSGSIRNVKTGAHNVRPHTRGRPNYVNPQRVKKNQRRNRQIKRQLSKMRGSP